MKLRRALLRYINLFLICLTVFVSFFAFSAWIELQPVKLPEAKNKELACLPYSFQQQEEQLKAIDKAFLALEKNEIRTALPDLRNTLLYFGSNVRPDVSQEASAVQMGFRGNQSSFPVPTKTKVYLKYEPKMGNMAARWSFSENNAPTATWIEATPQENNCQIQVRMSNSEGQEIAEPPEFATITLPLMHMPFNAQAGANFEIGGFRVDGSLLIRQKAVWRGQDLFLQELGGDEYAFAKEKERIDFFDPENPYFCFAGLGDCLAYFEGRWHEVKPGPDSRNKPLLVVRKIDERGMGFDLWDASGKARVMLELHKAPVMPAFAAKFDIKLVGARSKRDWIAEVSGNRMLLRADDWLLCNQEGWHKINTPQALDDFVNGTSRGILLVLEGTEKEGSDVGLVGKLFDETRTQVVPLRISLFKSWQQAGQAGDVREVEADDEDDDDLDDDEDDDDEILDDDDDEDDE